MQDPSFLLRLKRFAFAPDRARRLSNWARHRDVERHVNRLAGRASRSIVTFTSRAELAQLYRLANLAPQGADALEIGSHLGASACYIASAMMQRGGRVYCVDTWNNEAMLDEKRDTFAEFRNNTARVSQAIVAVRKRSEDLQRGDVPTELGFVFIDGDHSFEACRKDFETVRGWLVPNGIIAFHDAISPLKPPTYPGVQRVVGMALAGGDWQFGGFADSLCWIRRT